MEEVTVDHRQEHGGPRLICGQQSAEASSTAKIGQKNGKGT